MKWEIHFMQVSKYGFHETVNIICLKKWNMKTYFVFEKKKKKKAFYIILYAF